MTCINCQTQTTFAYFYTWRSNSCNNNASFAQLLQVAGRAGRAGLPGEVLIQTEQPQHPLYQALARHDYPAFAAQQLQEREQAGMPPFAFQALVRAEARSQDVAQGFLTACSEAATALQLEGLAQTSLYPPVPMTIQRVANVERAQMLVESPSRAALQRFLGAWHEVLQDTRQQPAHKGLIRWAVDVDPQMI